VPLSSLNRVNEEIPNSEFNIAMGTACVVVVYEPVVKCRCGFMMGVVTQEWRFE
jgi:hypothetical protein